MRRALSLTLLLSAALLVRTPGVEAQTITSPYRYVETTQSVSGFVGYLWTDRGELGIGPHSAPILGARYRARFTGPLAGEVLLGVVPTQRTVFIAPIPGDSTIPIRPIAGDNEESSLLVTMQAGLVFNLTGPRTWNGLAPYAGAGVGFVADALGSGALDETVLEDQRFEFGPGLAVGVSLGTDWYVSERLSVRAELRDHLWRIESPQGLLFALEPETEWTHNLGLTLGASLHF